MQKRVIIFMIPNQLLTITKIETFINTGSYWEFYVKKGELI